MTHPPPSYRTNASEQELAHASQSLSLNDHGVPARPSSPLASIADSELTLTAPAPAAASISTSTVARDGVVRDEYNHNFHATRTLIINAKGTASMRCHKETTITDQDGRSLYVSKRTGTWSKDTILSSPMRGDLVATRYKWAHSASLHLLQQTSPTAAAAGNEQSKITSSRKWGSRSMEFKPAAGSGAVDFSWHCRDEQYIPAGSGASAANKSSKHASRDKKKRRILALEVSASSTTHNNEKPGVRRIAQLLRDKDTRTPGTRSCTAGNGGYVLIDAEAARQAGLADEVVVASCIAMLTREVDRRRAMIAAGAAGGSS